LIIAGQKELDKIKLFQNLDDLFNFEQIQQKNPLDWDLKDLERNENVTNT
jgi:hypothetical protein